MTQTCTSPMFLGDVRSLYILISKRLRSEIWGVAIGYRAHTADGSQGKSVLWRLIFYPYKTGFLAQRICIFQTHRYREPSCEKRPSSGLQDAVYSSGLNDNLWSFYQALEEFCKGLLLQVILIVSGWKSNVLQSNTGLSHGSPCNTSSCILDV